ncbi:MULTISPECIES: AraC family transcriptional regulator [Pseudomonas]|uniref:AraC family transcriptional regulator n=1 Tax=Pseudomonas kuykendallii TaxID=1007099 RepID=A0A2W5DBH3_9PSED|nr:MULTISPECIES: AraC family transcriptional regulator [Pseudomonas]MCQ4271696.1 AraC family transcriptional regulator [Pseudomonas kuykendallii]PZP26437.1 MAG: AraC family transcriptional regulator [Pseudomonas kuykendallii]SDW10004.1 transcriptional regulator, AraC family [Pseudomonas kuykendallii]
MNNNWVELLQDGDTGIETIRAHFEGHAYDPHWHDSYLVGFTEQGVQQFHCRGARRSSTPGQVFLLEPGDIHDGHAPTAEGFTYRMLYLDPHWLERELCGLFEQAPEHAQLSFAQVLAEDPQLAGATASAFAMLHGRDIRIARQAALDLLLERLTRHLTWRTRMPACDPRLPRAAQRARDYLHAHLEQDLGMDQLAQIAGVDRYRLTRAFKAAYGLPPHAYLIQLRLTRARRLLARGETPALVAATLGFADQSHLGRWFRRAYALTPADYRTRCTNRPDR